MSSILKYEHGNEVEGYWIVVYMAQPVSYVNYLYPSEKGSTT